MQTPKVSAVLFAKDLDSVSRFYAEALVMTCTKRDEHHSILSCHGFDLVVHQIPPNIADGIVIAQPPERRAECAIRLDFPVRDIEYSRRTARSLGGDIDSKPPGWADPQANVFLGFDPEGNVFAVSKFPQSM